MSRFIRRGSLGARGELLRVLGMRVDVVVFVAGVRGSLPHTPRGAFLQWSGRGSRIGMVEGPATDHRDRHMSHSLCFVAFVRLNNLAQNHFRTCPPAVRVTPAGTCSMHPRRGHDQKFEEQFVSTACVVCTLCMHSVFSTHPQQAAHPVLEQPHIEGACRGRGQRWNSRARFTLPLRGHSPGPSGLGGVYFSKLLRANIFRSAAGQGSERSIAGSFWRGACRGVVHTVLRCSRTGFCTSRRETFESLKGAGKQWRKKTQTTREEHRHRARGVGG